MCWKFTLASLSLLIGWAVDNLANGVEAQCPVQAQQVIPKAQTDLSAEESLTYTAWQVRIGQLNLDEEQPPVVIAGLIGLLEDPLAPEVLRRNAALTLGRLGKQATAAIPTLIRRLEACSQSATKNRPPGSVDSVDFTPTNEECALWAIKAFGLFGPLARESTPRLIELYDRPGQSAVIRFSILDTLSQIAAKHPAVIPFLTQIATDSSERQAAYPSQNSDAAFVPIDFQRAAVEALGVIGPDASASVPAILRLLDSTDESLRREAVVSLGRIGPPEEFVLQPLMERIVVDESAAIRDFAATALGNFGVANSGERIAQLLEYAEDVEDHVRLLQIFQNWGTAAQPWIKNLKSEFLHENGLVRLAAFAAVWRVTETSEDVASKVVQEFANDDHLIRRDAYRLFVRLNQSGQNTAIEALKALRSHSRPETRRLAEKVLKNLKVSDTGAD